MGQREKISGFMFLMQRAAYVFTALMIGIFPLFHQHGYRDIMRAKLAFFHVCFWGFVIIVVFLGILEFAHRDKSVTIKDRIQGMILSKWDAEMVFAAVFLLAIFLSTAFAQYPAEAWKGTEGRKMGGEMMLICMVMYLMVSKLLRPDRRLIPIFLASGTLVFILGILNFWGMDILNMYGGVASRQYGKFISTIGNINANASYLCLVLPVMMVLYTLAETPRAKLIRGGVLILGFYEAYTTLSESWILGIGASYLVLLWHSLKGNRKMMRFLELCGLFWLSSLLMKATLLAGEAWETESVMFADFQKLKLQNWMLEGHVLLISGLLLAGVAVFLHIMIRDANAAPYEGIKKAFFALLAAIAVMGAVLLVIANFFGGWKEKARWLRWFKLRDSFGTNRGYIWKRTARAWIRLPLKQKIFGYGLNCFQQFIDVDYGAEIRQRYTRRFVDAHNEFLQFLVTTGIVGAIGYFGMIISAAWSCAKAAKGKPVMLMGTAALAGFLAQGMVNNPTGFITPNLFLFLGIIRSLRKN